MGYEPSLTDGARMLQQHKRLLYKLAISSWRQLPPSVRMWVEVDDLVADAQVYIWALARKRYKKRMACETTFLWNGVSNLFKNYGLKHSAKKRFGWRMDLEEGTWAGKPDRQIAQYEALEALSKIYKQASEPCRRSIRLWFGQRAVRPRRAASEQLIYQEFYQLALRNGLTRENCLELMRSGVRCEGR